MMLRKISENSKFEIENSDKWIIINLPNSYNTMLTLNVFGVNDKMNWLRFCFRDLPSSWSLLRESLGNISSGFSVKDNSFMLPSSTSTKQIVI
jgi:hypothetical protein